jgi:hypothetical protein
MKVPLSCGLTTADTIVIAGINLPDPLMVNKVVAVRAIHKGIPAGRLVRARIGKIEKKATTLKIL